MRTWRKYLLLLGGAVLALVVPALLTMLQDSSEGVRDAATNALRMIAPEEMERADALHAILEKAKPQ